MFTPIAEQIRRLNEAERLTKEGKHFAALCLLLNKDKNGDDKE